MRLLLLLLLLLASACAPTSVIRKDIAHRTWTEVASPRVLLYTDGDPDEAERLVADIERWQQALIHLYAGMVGPERPPPATRLAVVFLDDCADLQPLWGDSTAGRASLSGDFDSRRMFLTCRRPAWAQRETVIHELSHLVNFHYYPELPVWLEEGLASYFQTVTFEDGEIVVGQDTRKHRRASVYLPPLRELLAMSHEQFHAMEDHTYPAAWRVVHLLAASSDDYQGRFRRLLGALAVGERPAVAWEDALGDVPLDRLEREYRDYMATGEIAVSSAPYTPVEPPPMKRRVLDRGEIHDVWLRTIVTFRDDPGALAAAQLATAAADVPGWAGVEYWSGLLAIGGDRRDLDAAERHLRTYTAAHPDDVRGWIGVIEVALMRTGDDGIAARPSAGLADLTREAAELQRRARSASALNTLAWYLAIRRRPDAGLRIAQRALVADPSCASCENTLALLLYQLGRHGEAVAHQERAIRLAGERVWPSATARLRRYRSAAVTPVSR